MKQNHFLTFGLLIVNVCMHASHHQIEGQPGAMPPGGAPVFNIAAFSAGAASSSSLSASASIARYYDKGTQTDISAQNDEQVRLRVGVLLKEVDNIIVQSTERALSRFEQKAKQGSILHAQAIKQFKKLLENNKGYFEKKTSLHKDNEICKILRNAKLMEVSVDDYCDAYFVLKADIIDAYNQTVFASDSPNSDEDSD